MNKEQVIDALKKAKETSKKRNFKQTVDLVINLKDIDLKKSEQQVNLSVPLHYSNGKTIKVCALVGPELLTQAKDVCDNALSVDEFGKYTNKKDIKKLANDYDYFIAQATIMPKIATAFGRVFGPKGKMPNPKAGCVVPPNANLKPLYERLQKTIKVVTKNDPIIQCAVGKEEMKDEEVIDNIMTIYDALVHALPNEKHNIKAVYLKLTMGKAIKVGEKVKEEVKIGKKKGKAKEAKEKKEEAKPKEEKKEKQKIKDTETKGIKDSRGFGNEVSKQSKISGTTHRGFPISESKDSEKPKEKTESTKPKTEEKTKPAENKTNQ